MSTAPVQDGSLSGVRFHFLDALRGVAALAVLFHHLEVTTVMGPLPSLTGLLPEFLLNAAGIMNVGVQVFFVISGFVIAHSLRATPMNGRGVGRFIFRRQVRLDPPYWCAMLLVLGIALAERMLPSLEATPTPSAPGILANAFYLHRILGYPELLGVAWTLCIEVQFYLGFVLLLAASAFVAARLRIDTVRIAAPIVLVLGVLPLVWPMRFPDMGMTWLVPHLSYFAGGALVYWAYTGRTGHLQAVAFTVAFAAAAAVTPDRFLITGAVTTAAIYGVAVGGQLARWGSAGPLTWLGRVSYSLYLVHLPVLGIVAGLGRKLTGDDQWAALGWLGAAATVSLIAAAVFHRLIEAPSRRFSAALAPRRTAVIASSASGSTPHSEGLTVPSQARSSRRSAPQFCYVVTDSGTGEYADLAYVSASFLRTLHPDARIVVLTQTRTVDALRERSHPLLEVVDECRCACDEITDPRLASRCLKVTMRRHLQGDFVFLDADTIPVRSLDELFNCTAPIAGAIDFNRDPDEGFFPDEDVELFDRLNWTRPRHYLNTGVLFLRDVPDAHSFTDRWHALWRQAVEADGFANDQPTWNAAAGAADIEIALMPPRYNTMLLIRPDLAGDAAVFHYFCGITGVMEDTLIAELLGVVRSEGRLSEQRIRKTLRDRFPWRCRDSLRWQWYARNYAACVQIALTRFARRVFPGLSGVQRA